MNDLDKVVYSWMMVFDDFIDVGLCGENVALQVEVGAIVFDFFDGRTI